MNKKLVAIIVVVISLLGLVIFRPKSTCDASSKDCYQSDQPQTKQSKADIVQSELKGSKALLVDVREPDEFATGHAENSKNIPLSGIKEGKLTEVDKNKKIYVYCRSGKRAGVAKESLEERGYANVENLGGLSDWQSMGGRVLK